MKIAIDHEDLRPIIEQAVDAAVARIAGIQISTADKLAYRETDAAAMLSMNRYQLRDERLRGRIKASVGPGSKILYTRQDLLDYLASRRWRAD